MASEILSVPEEKLPEVIKVIRAGLKATEGDTEVTLVTRRQLITWCRDEEQYLDRLAREE